MVGNSGISEGIKLSLHNIFFYLCIPSVRIEFFVPSTKFSQLFLWQLRYCFFNIFYGICHFP